MITRFSTLYVGHIELERCGLAGVPADDRRYANERLAETFDTAAALAQAADTLGYETLWLAEHHFQHEGYECIPSIPMLAVDLAHRTRRVKIGCAFNVVPAWHPLRLAEDYAVADILTRGRVVFGVGRGYHTREVETFGNPMLDAEANRELFEEQVEIILKALREESFSHRGKHYTLPPEVPYRGYSLKEITLVPRPLRQPVEVWQPIVSGSARGLDFMARHRIKGVISATAEELVQRWVRDYQETARRHGRALELGEELILGFRMCIDDTVERAIERARPYFEEHAKVMAPLGMLRYSEEHARAVAARQPQSPTSATLENGVRNRSWLCGLPGDIIAYLKEVEGRYPGLDHVMIGWAIGTPRALMVEQLTRFAREVMPAFRP
ncbi:MAG TPA: LLM class flavin-dependent oxidoreductase [Candidatus Limnocylindria bacterium]|nr:LLM class flavin-dependent oxidoreductase [Candidatus Limnocylindria bacterium]